MHQKLYRLLLAASLPFAMNGLSYGQANLPDPFPHPPSASGSYYENRGQIIDEQGNLHPEIKFYTEKTFPAIFLADDKVSFVSFWQADTVSSPGAVDSIARIDMRFVCNKGVLKPTSPLVPPCGEIGSYEQVNDHLNYYLAHCGTGIEDVLGYSRVVYHDAYPDIDVHFYSNAWAPKIYFVVKPGGDPNDILLELEGQDSIKTLTSGSLAVYLRSWSLQFPQAFSYQIDGSNNTTIMPWLPTWNHAGGGMIDISVGTYNPAETLVIAIGGAEEMPTAIDNLGWSVYYGGSGEERYPRSFANDNNVLYHAMSVRGGGDFLSEPGEEAPYVLQNLWGSGADWYVSRFDPDGVRKWGTYYGHRGEEVVTAIEEQFPGENEGSLWVAGGSLSDSMNLGTAAANFRQLAGGGLSVGNNMDGLLGCFAKSNGKLEYATFFGARYGSCDIVDISIDNVSNRLYFVGNIKNDPANSFYNPTVFNNNCSAQTTGSFPLCSGTGRYFQGSLFTPYNNGEGFIAELNLNNKSLAWSTLFGGNGHDQIYSVLKVHNDNENSLYIGGATGALPSGEEDYPSPITSNSNQYFPLADPGGSAFFQSSVAGRNFFISKFNGSHQLEWSTFLGHSEGGISDLAMNSEGKLYFTGFDSDRIFEAPSNSPSPNASGYVPVYTDGTSYAQIAPLTNSTTLIGRFNADLSLGWSAVLPGPTNLLDNYTGGANVTFYGPSIAIDKDDRIFWANYLQLCEPEAYDSDGNYFLEKNASDGTTHPWPFDGYLMVFKNDETINWSTFFGGDIQPAPGLTSMDATCDVSVAGSQYLYLTGVTGCSNSPYKECLNAVPGSYCDESYNYGSDCYISRFDITDLPDPEPLSVSDISHQGKKVVVYPNPAYNRITIGFSNDFKAAKASVSIIDATGRILKKTDFQAQTGINQFSLDISGIAAGLYIVEIGGNFGKVSTKFNKL